VRECSVNLLCRCLDAEREQELTARLEPELRALLKTWGDFSLSLRYREPFDETMFNDFRDALQACAIRWEGERMIPRLLANVLVDVYMAVDACASGYRDDEAEQIRDAAIGLQDLVHQCVGISPSEMEEYDRQL
jgi:hypothetical protein